MKKIAVLVMAALMMVFVATAAFAESVTVTGTVEMTDQGATLMAEGVTYILDGDGVEDMTGKTVTVTGTVEEGEGDAKLLMVDTIEEAN